MQCCLGFASALGRYSPTWSQVIRLFCRQLTQPRAGVWCASWRFISSGTEKKCKSKYFVSPPDKSFCLFLSFVQVALSRVMPLKCQLSVWACIALDIKYSSPHTKTAVSRSVVQKEIKYGACTSLFPGGPVHLLFVRVTDVFQMMVSHVCWTSTKALPWETARRYTPSDGGNLHGLNPSAVRLSAGKSNNRGRGCQGGLPRWSQHLTEQQQARTWTGSTYTACGGGGSSTKLKIHS